MKKTNFLAKLTQKRLKAVGGGQSFKKDMMYIGVLLGGAITLLFINFWYVAKEDGFDKLYISQAGELRILSQSIAKNAQRAVDGDPQAFNALRERRDSFIHILAGLKDGDPELGFPATIKRIRDKEIAALEETWYPIKGNADIILKRRETLLSLHEIAGSLRGTAPKLQQEHDRILTALLQNPSATSMQIVAASRLSWLLERIVRSMDKITSGSGDTKAAADSFRFDSLRYYSVLKQLTEGDSDVKKITNRESVESLQTLKDLFSFISENMETIIQSSRELALVQDAASAIFLESAVLLESANQLTHAYSTASDERLLGPLSGYLLGGICLLLLGWLGYRIYADTKLNLSLSAAQNKGNQAAIKRLLKELENLADGDLTGKATVSKDITGEIAESVNYAIDALRKLVFTINGTAIQVTSAARDAQATSTQLAEASEDQAREIMGATAAINAMAAAIEHVSTNASESAHVADKAVQISGRGAEIVQGTMQSMDRIREQIQETSKRMKCLGESSQEIGDTVSIIEDIADQTNILALNAAIQAAMAGESGRGFAVVADEVQRLAERSGEATRQIDALVRAIQNDTNEAVHSMEQSTSEVAMGARKAQDAGVALEKIESVSTHLADLIQNISDAAQQQAVASSKVSKNMSVIQEITTKTASATTATAGSIGNLAELANELKNSVAGFNLPAELS